MFNAGIVPSADENAFGKNEPNLIKESKFYSAACSRIGLNNVNNLNMYCLRRNEIIKSDAIDFILAQYIKIHAGTRRFL